MEKCAQGIDSMATLPGQRKRSSKAPYHVFACSEVKSSNGNDSRKLKDSATDGTVVAAALHQIDLRSRSSRGSLNLHQRHRKIEVRYGDELRNRLKRRYWNKSRARRTD
jgi:hypothetical protein